MVVMGVEKQPSVTFWHFRRMKIMRICELAWKDDIPLKTLVYNRQFREENFGKGNINGVFTLGHATKEELEIIENKKKSLSVLIEEGKKQRSSWEKLKTDLKTVQEEFRVKLGSKFIRNMNVILKKLLEDICISRLLWINS